MKTLKLSKTEEIWLSENKRKVMQFVRVNPITANSAQSSVLMPQWGYRAMLAGALMLLLIFGVGSNQVAASFTILPNNPLYPIKLTAEKLQGLLIFDDSKKLDFVIQLAQKRMEELKQTLDQNGGVPDASVVNSVLNQYSQLMDQASQNIDKLASKGNQTALLSASKKLQNSKPENVLSQLKSSKENSEALLSAESAALATEGKAVGALKQIDKDQQDQTKIDSESQITSLDKKLVELGDLMDQAKSTKGYIVLGDAYSHFEKAQSLLEQARKDYEQGNYLQAIDQANNGSKEAIEVRRRLFNLLDLKLDLETDTTSASSSVKGR